jgi:hypothetical protein
MGRCRWMKTDTAFGLWGRSPSRSQTSTPCSSLRDLGLLAQISIGVLCLLLIEGAIAPAAGWSSPSSYAAGPIEANMVDAAFARVLEVARADLEVRSGLLRPPASMHRGPSGQLWRLVDRASGLGRAMQLRRSLHLGSVDGLRFEARMTGPLLRPGGELRFRFGI